MTQNSLYVKMRGVTLLELMIVVVVLAIIVTVAIPNYFEFSARAKRAEAKAALLQIATNQEREYLQNNTYTTNMMRLGFEDAGCNTSGSGSYTICVDAADANTFTASATWIRGGAEADKCGAFQIDGRGVKRSTPDTDCWTRTR
ncbi:MAG: type IV pilin protein [Pseudomonadota bacterium]